MAAALSFGVDPLPDEVEVGRGVVLLVRGWIAAEPRRLLVELDGATTVQPSRGELRFDVPLVEGRPPYALFVPVRISGDLAGRTLPLRISTEHDGRRTTLVEHTLTFTRPARRTLDIDAPIVICLGTYEPDEPHLVRQLESLRAQTRRDWICIVRDDASSPAKLAMIRRLVGDDERFRLVCGERNLGFYRNFEAALALVPSSTPYVALCDQDDCWAPDKLAATIEALERDSTAQLAYCDMRIVDDAGNVLSPTFWRGRRNNWRRLDTLLCVNTVTGAASVFRGALLDRLLPFPPAVGRTFHDHWLACTAFVAGGLAYVDRPLYDYTQHGGNVIGHADFAALDVAGALKRHGFNIAEMLLKPQRVWTNVWTMLAFYLYEYRRVHLMCETLRLRFPDLGSDAREIVSLFDDDPRRALELMIRRHADIVRRGDSTDMIEFKMGLGMLLHHRLGRWLAPVVGRSERLMRASARIVLEHERRRAQ
jgi:glycosyltransferase involved in cell wall biosynthesis